MGLGLLFYILLGFRQLLFKDNQQWPGLEFRVWGLVTELPYLKSA